jgi:hypothetical protein
MRKALGFLSAATLGLMGIVVLETVHDPDPGLEVWAVAILGALLTLGLGVVASVQVREVAWLGCLLAAGLVSILGLAVTFLIPSYPNWMLGGLRLHDLINVAPFLPACAGVVGMAYSCFPHAPTAPKTALTAGVSGALGASTPHPPVGA